MEKVVLVVLGVGIGVLIERKVKKLGKKYEVVIKLKKRDDEE